MFHIFDHDNKKINSEDGSIRLLGSFACGIHYMVHRFDITEIYLFAFYDTSRIVYCRHISWTSYRNFREGMNRAKFIVSSNFPRQFAHFSSRLESIAPFSSFVCSINELEPQCCSGTRCSLAPKVIKHRKLSQINFVWFMAVSGQLWNEYYQNGRRI